MDSFHLEFHRPSVAACEGMSARRMETDADALFQNQYRT